jgi:adenylate kinase
MVYTLDIALDIQYLALIFPHVQLSSALQQAIFDDPELLDFLQAILFLRNEPRHHQRIKAGYQKYRHYLSDITYMQPLLFHAPEINEDTLHEFIDRKPLILLRVLGWRECLSIVRYSLRRRFKKVQPGRVVSIVGVDGAGKTTIINTLSGLDRVRTQYMGDGFFRLASLYTYLDRFGLIGRKINYTVQYGETWWRYFHCRRLAKQGYVVITDRWPGYNRHLLQLGISSSFAQKIFSLIPKPDTMIMLTASTATILARKQELTAEEKDEYETRLKQKLSQHNNWYEIHNEHVNDTVRKILPLIYTTSI